MRTEQLTKNHFRIYGEVGPAKSIRDLKEILLTVSNAI